MYSKYKLLGINWVQSNPLAKINKRRTIDTVPQRYRDAVLADLAALGLDGNGDPLQP